MSMKEKLHPGRALALCALALATFGAGAAAPQPAVAPQAVPPGLGLTSWQDNGSNGRYVLQVIQARRPSPASASSAWSPPTPTATRTRRA